jgi:hypothetical protein
MLNIWKWTRPAAAMVMIATIHCSRKATTASSSSTPLAKEDNNGAASSTRAPAAEPPPLAKGPGPSEWYACKKSEECAVMYEDHCCMPDCDPLVFKGYTAINAKYRTEFVARLGCSNTKCDCPPIPEGIPRSDSNFFALCQQSRCVAVDLRRSKYAECETAKDCALRFGLGCCEGCGDKDLVTYNPKSTLTAEICSTKEPKCPPVPPACLAKRHSYQNAECAVNYCQLSD